MQKIVNYELIELIVPQGATATRYFFPDQPQLRFVSLMNLEAYSWQQNTSFGTVISPLSGTKLISSNVDLPNAYLVLYYNDKESVNRMPLSMLQRNIGESYYAPTPSVFQTYPFAGQQIIWAKSYVQFSVAPVDNSASPFSIPLGVYWA